MSKEELLDLLEELWMDCTTDSEENDETFLKAPDTSTMLKVGQALRNERMTQTFSADPC